MNASPQQLDIFGGPDAGAMLRDAGMIEAEFAEALTGSDFAEALGAAIRHVARRQIEVHADDVLPLIKTKPSHPNAAGIVWVQAINDGTLVKTGRTKPCLSDPIKHKHNYPVYRSGIFHRRRG